MPIKKILVVDDSPTERLFLKELLVKHGYLVALAEAGQAAIEKARLVQPDLILLDVVMPGINGFQVTRTLSRDATLKAIPIFLCTAKAQETDKIWGLRQGAKDYIIKPIDSQVLLEKIRNFK